MEIIIGILAFIFMLSFIVVIHELGHYIVARSFGVYCHEFSIGMGPAIYQKKGKMTTFSIRAIPLGGYVMMAGESDHVEGDESDWLSDVPENQRLYQKPAWQQICVMAAGVAMNIILAWAIFVGLSMYRGYVVEDAPHPVVYEVSENSPAMKAGLQKEDEIIRVSADGETVTLDEKHDMLEFIQFHHDDVTLTILRGDEELEVTLQPAYDEEVQGYLIGIVTMSSVREIAWYESFKYGTIDMVNTTSTIFRTLGMLFKGKGYENLSGPAGIYTVTQKTVSYGLASYIALIGMISLNIGIFNLIPIPALDGGRILILLIERILRRKVNPKVVESIILGSFVLLFGLMIFATYNDILRIFF